MSRYLMDDWPLTVEEIQDRCDCSRQWAWFMFRVFRRVEKIQRHHANGPTALHSDINGHGYHRRQRAGARRRR